MAIYFQYYTHGLHKKLALSEFLLFQMSILTGLLARRHYKIKSSLRRIFARMKRTTILTPKALVSYNMFLFRLQLTVLKRNRRKRALIKFSHPDQIKNLFNPPYP